MISPGLIWITFGIYIVFLISVAIIESRMNKANSTHGFATGGGKIRWPILVMTYIASLMSTWTFFAGPGAYYRGGFGYWVSELSYICLFPLIMHFVMNKVWIINQERNCITPADFYDIRFRSPVLRVILAVIFLASSLPYVASVLIAISTAANLVTGGRIPYQYVVIIIGITIAVYTMLGGLKSIALTDTIQGVAYISILWIIVIACLIAGFDGSLTKAISTIWENTNGWFSYPGPDGWVPYGARFGYPFSCAIGWTVMLPHVFVRSGYAGSDLKSQRKLMVMTPVLQALVWTATMLIGLVGIALFPGLEAADTEYLIPYLIEHVIQGLNPTAAVVLIMGFFLGAVAVGISTADSFLLVSGTIVSEDILHHTFKMNLSEKNQLKVTRIVIAVLGVLSVCIAINPPGLLYTLIMFAIAIVMPLFPILVLGLYWKRATKEGAVAGAVVGTILVLMTYFTWNIGGTWYGAIGLFGAAAAMIVVSLLTKKDEKVCEEFFSLLQKAAARFYDI